MNRFHFSAVLSVVIPLTLTAMATGGVPKNDPKPNEQRELHVVGLYEGVYKTKDQIHGGKATVTVDRPGKRVTLLLSSYDPVTWEIKLGDKTQLEQVILGGYKQQAVTGLPGNVEVVEAFRGGKSKKVLWSGYKIETVQFRTTVHQLAELTGLKIASFQGDYRYRHEAPFVIDRVQDDPRLDLDYPKPTPAKELPKLAFKALNYNFEPRHGGITDVSYGDFTLQGPDLNSLKPLPKNIYRLALDPAGMKSYGIAYPDHAVAEVDLMNQKFTKMELGLDVPPLSWPSDLAFDTKRQRLLLTSSAGGGYLYVYSPNTGKWSAIVEKPGVDAFTYHPKHDAIYGFTPGHFGEDAVPTLIQFNPHGAVVKRTPLSAPMHRWMVSGGPGVCRTQLVPVNEYLVILTGPGGHGGEGGIIQGSYIFLVGPKTGKVQLAWKENK